VNPRHPTLPETARALAPAAAEGHTVGEPLVRIRDLEVRFPRSEFALHLEDLTIRRGERIALLGSSGSGKTTLLRAIKGLVRITAGEVAVLGATGPVQAPRERMRSVALIYQQFNLVGRSTVYENILAGCLGRLPAWRVALGLFPGPERQAALRAADELGLEQHLLARADRISGGQQQRVAIARAVLQRAPLVLGDEPVASLDPETGAQVLDALLAAAALHGQGLVLSLHDPDAARTYASRVIGLRAGRVVFDLPAQHVGPTELAGLYGGSRYGW
jgi:phosphonate transport system ATP-binding protein